MRRLSEFEDIDEAEAAILAGAVIDDLPVVLEGEGGRVDFGLATKTWGPGEAIIRAGVVWSIEGAPRRGERIRARAATPVLALALLFWKRDQATARAGAA